MLKNNLFGNPFIVASTGKVKLLWKEQITGKKKKMEKIYAYNFHICEGTINAECIYNINIMQVLQQHMLWSSFHIKIISFFSMTRPNHILH